MKRIVSFFVMLLLLVGIIVPTEALAKKNKNTTTTIVSTSKVIQITTTTTTTTSTTTTTGSVVTKPSKPQNLTALESVNSVVLNWTKVLEADGYSVSRSFDRDKWKRISRYDGNTNYYIDNEPLDNVACYYSIKAFKYVNGKRKFSKKSNVVTIFYGINLFASSRKKYTDLKWQPVEDADGYEIFYSENNFDFEFIYDIQDGSTTSYTHSGITPFKSNYYFYIKAYKRLKKNNKQYILTSNSVCASDTEAIVNGSIRESKTSFKTTNVQGKKPKLYCVNQISAADLNTIKKFEKNYLTSDMSPYFKSYYVLKHINKKVEYANTSELWSKISGSSYVDAIFNKKAGQCAQYNGAMIAYLSYLGLNNAKLMLGYRGYSTENCWQHFWGQVKLRNGKYYVVETGNYGNDGDWYYFFTPYKNTKKFLKCGKYVSGIY
ncbi:MAG: hypothetical protein IJD90_02505 [Clostridia bacterium]|nr:hypothetical protein [Clostridia bacterium]